MKSAHPSLSYKFRGMSLFVREHFTKLGKDVHFLIGSGGNAGTAAACAANVVGARCTVYMPEGAAETTVRFLKDQNAEVEIVGKFYQEAFNAAKQAALADKNA